MSIAQSITQSPSNNMKSEVIHKVRYFHKFRVSVVESVTINPPHKYLNFIKLLSANTVKSAQVTTKTLVKTAV